MFKQYTSMSQVLEEFQEKAQKVHQHHQAKIDDALSEKEDLQKRLNELSVIEAQSSAEQQKAKNFLDNFAKMLEA